MNIIYLVQINMADQDRNPEWDNCRAFQTREAAKDDVEWMLGEYGDTIEYRIVELEFHQA